MCVSGIRLHVQEPPWGQLAANRSLSDAANRSLSDAGACEWGQLSMPFAQIGVGHLSVMGGRLGGPKMFAASARGIEKGAI